MNLHSFINGTRTKYSLVGLGALVFFSVFLMVTVLGIPPIIVAVILICFLFVLAFTVGCALNLKLLESSCHEEELQQRKLNLLTHITEIDSIISSSKTRLSGYTDGSNRYSRSSNLAGIKHLIDAIQERKEKILLLLEKEEQDGILLAEELFSKPLSVDGKTLGSSAMSELQRESWADALNTLLSGLESEKRALA